MDKIAGSYSSALIKSCQCKLWNCCDGIKTQFFNSHKGQINFEPYWITSYLHYALFQ